MKEGIGLCQDLTHVGLSAHAHNLEKGCCLCKRLKFANGCFLVLKLGYN